MYDRSKTKLCSNSNLLEQNDLMTNQNPEQGLGKGMIIVAWLTVMGLLTLFFSNMQNQRENPNAMPASTSAAGVNEVILRRNHQHHYIATGSINGKSVTFLVDTGATHVSVPKHIADDLGLHEGARELANTANGVVETRATSIDELVLGSVRLRDIRASINPGMRQDAVLLGMSALKEVEFIHRDGQLTLRQYY